MVKSKIFAIDSRVTASEVHLPRARGSIVKQQTFGKQRKVLYPTISAAEQEEDDL